MEHTLDAILPSWVDRFKASRIAQLRGMGFTQAEIASQLRISQQTVSRYMVEIKRAATQSPDAEDFLWSLLLIGGGLALATYLFRKGWGD